MWVPARGSRSGGGMRAPGGEGGGGLDLGAGAPLKFRINSLADLQGSSKAHKKTVNGKSQALYVSLDPDEAFEGAHIPRGSLYLASRQG